MAQSFILIFSLRKLIVLVLTREHMGKHILIHEGRQNERESILKRSIWNTRGF